MCLFHLLSDVYNKLNAEYMLLKMLHHSSLQYTRLLHQNSIIHLALRSNPYPLLPVVYHPCHAQCLLLCFLWALRISVVAC